MSPGRNSVTSPLVTHSFADLIGDKGWIGEALGALPDWMLRAAARDAEQNAEYQKKHHGPNRLPCPDPWQFLLDAPGVSPQVKKVCRAAQSQLSGFRCLCRMATGVATLNTDWQQQAVKARRAGDMARSDHAARKLASALSHFTLASTMAQEWSHGDAARQQNVAAWQRRWHKQLVHRGQWSDAEGSRLLPRWSEIQRAFPSETLLVFGWVRFCPGGPPGFMFWSKVALAQYTEYARRKPAAMSTPESRLHCVRDINLMRNVEASCSGVKKLCQRLGLLPVNDPARCVWRLAIEPGPGGGFSLTGTRRNGAELFRLKGPHFQ